MRTTSTTSASLHFDYGKKCVPLNRITHFRSQFGNYTKVFLTENQTYLSSFTLKHYSGLLEDSEIFFQPRKGFIVNKSFVKGFREQADGLMVVLKNGESIKVSRRKTEAVLLELTQMD